MFNFNYITKGDIKEHNPNWPEIPDHPYRILLVGRSGSGNTNTWLNLINHEPDIKKIHWYAKDPYEAKYQLLIKKGESTVLKYLNNSKAFIEYSNDVNDIYKILSNTIQIVWFQMIWFLIRLAIKKLIQQSLTYLLEEEN